MFHHHQLLDTENDCKFQSLLMMLTVKPRYGFKPMLDDMSVVAANTHFRELLKHFSFNRDVYSSRIRSEVDVPGEFISAVKYLHHSSHSVKRYCILVHMLQAASFQFYDYIHVWLAFSNGLAYCIAGRPDDDDS